MRILHLFPTLFLTLHLAAEPKNDLMSLGPSGGDVRSLAVHPQAPEIFFIGTSDGQIFKSVDSARSWRRLDPGLGLRNLVIDNLRFDPFDPQRLYAGAWSTKNDLGWLFVSEDGGDQWREIDLSPHQSSVRAIAIAPGDPKMIALGVSEGVILSRDQGQTWERITRGYRSLYNVNSLAFDPSEPETLYVGTWRRGWRTHDLGKKWIPIHQGMAYDSDMFGLLVSPDDSSTLFASACTGIYKSLDRGDLWTKLTNGIPKGANRTRSIVLDPLDSKTIYAGTTAGLFKSSNSGGLFSRIHEGIVVNGIAVHPARPKIVVVATDDKGVLRSEDAGKTFHSANQGFVHRQISALAAHQEDSAVLYAAVAGDGLEGGFFYSRDRGTSWTVYNSGLEAVASEIAAIVPIRGSSTVFLHTASRIFAGTPGEKPWAPFNLNRRLSIRDLAASPQGDAFLVAAAEGIFRIEAGTSTVVPLKIAVYEGPTHCLASHPETGRVFLGNDMGVFGSDDGRQWTIKVHGLPLTPVWDLAVAGDNLLALTPDGPYLGRQLGESWEKLKAPSRQIDLLTVAPSRPSSVCLTDAPSSSVYCSPDGGETWEALYRGSAPSRLSSLLITASGQLLMGTLSDGLFAASGLRPESEASSDSLR